MVFRSAGPLGCDRIVRIALRPLVGTMAELEERVRYLDKRVGRLEEKM